MAKPRLRGGHEHGPAPHRSAARPEDGSPADLDLNERVKLSWSIDGRIAEIDLIVATPDRWAELPESDRAGRLVVAAGPILVAGRCLS